MARRKKDAFGRGSSQGDDWRAWGIGVFTGVVAIMGLWLASSRGVSLDWRVVAVGALVCTVAGLVMLKLEKAVWSPRRRRWFETLGFMLMGPVIVAVALCLFYPILPSDFAGPVDRV